MRFYQLQVDPHGFIDSDDNNCHWFTSRAEAKKEQRRLQQNGTEVSFRVYDIPTKKMELLHWLNAYGNPSGFGYN